MAAPGTACTGYARFESLGLPGGQGRDERLDTVRGCDGDLRAQAVAAQGDEHEQEGGAGRGAASRSMARGQPDLNGETSRNDEERAACRPPPDTAADQLSGERANGSDGDAGEVSPAPVLVLEVAGR